MPNFEFTSPEGKKYTVAGPAGSTKEQAFQILQSQISGETPLVDQIPTANTAERLRQTESQPAAPANDGILAKASGALEVPLTMATGAVGGVAGNLAGLYAGLTSGKFGTQEGVKIAENRAHEISNALTYQPRTQTGNKLLQGIGEAVNASGIAGVPLPELAALGRTVAPARNALADLSQAGAVRVGEAGATAVNKLMPAKQSTLSGVGAAATPEATMRNQLAADLPVPIKLTKGQAERSFEQQKFERETAKLPEGEPLRQRFAEQNEKVIQNFDAWLDETGAQASNLRATGAAVVEALNAKKSRIKAEIRDAYTEAREAGHMSQEVNIKSLGDFLRENAGSAENAPILKSIQSQFVKKGEVVPPDRSLLLNSGPPDLLNRRISINDLEEMRKQIRREIQPGTPNEAFGQQMIKLIDEATEGQGGDKYQQARRMYENYSNEFKNKQAIDKLLSNKPGAKDRSVAYEDVFDRSIMRGSLDDVRAVRRTLQTAGPEGEQAWRELQGQTINHMKEEITKNVARDVNGNPIVSPAKLDKLVRDLDVDGKLDFIFGKKGAQQIRDMNDLAKHIYTSPPGSVNTSNTASVLIGLLDTAVSGSAGMPLPIGTALNYGMKKVKSNRLMRQVDEALNPLASPPKNALLR